MFSSSPHSGTHCLNCDLWDSGIAMIFRFHRPGRDSTPCFSLEQASKSKSQRGLVGAELNARARGTVPKYWTCLRRNGDGNLSNVRGVGRGVLEYRIHFGPGYRVYFGMEGDTLVVLLGGGTKRRQQNDIEAARNLWQEYRRRKRQEA